jgi:hydroxyacylglutathione hydrolase
LPPLAALTAPEVLRLQEEGVVVVDTRPAMQFAVGHVPGSVHISLTGQYASWAARILGLDTRLIIAGEDPEHVRESQLRLARVGVENVVGYLADGVTGWIRNGFELDYIPQVTAQEFAELREQEPGRMAVLDVREPAEVSGGTIEKSASIPLGELKGRTGELDRERPLLVYCRSGYRSSIATSLLRRAGFRNVANLIGGLDAWKAAGLSSTIPGSC